MSEHFVVDGDGVLTNYVKPFVRTRFNYDRATVSRETSLECCDPSRTQQNFKEECDINTIVERFGLTGHMPDNIRVPEFGDFTGVSDYHSMVNVVREAGESFMELPANIRDRFKNDPGEYVNFCLDSKNRPELESLGLVKKATVLPPADPVAVAPVKAEPAA